MLMSKLIILNLDNPSRTRVSLQFCEHLDTLSKKLPL